MSESHDRRKRRPKRVSEAAPVQVYLGHTERELLDRLGHQLGLSKSDVLRRSLAALEQQVLNPETHPTLRLIGLVDDDGGAAEGRDPATDHDAVLAAANDPARPRRRRGKA
jgi:hypothetical protein